MPSLLSDAYRLGMRLSCGSPLNSPSAHLRREVLSFSWTFGWLLGKGKGGKVESWTLFNTGEERIVAFLVRYKTPQLFAVLKKLIKSASRGEHFIWPGKLYASGLPNKKSKTPARPYVHTAEI